LYPPVGILFSEERRREKKKKKTRHGIPSRAMTQRAARPNIRREAARGK